MNMNFKFNLPPGNSSGNNEAKSHAFSSKEEAITNKFIEWLIRRGISPDTLTTEESIKDAIIKSHTNISNLAPEKIIAELKKSGHISVLMQPKMEKPPIAQIQNIGTEHISLKGLTTVANEEIAQHLEDNKLFLEKDIFKDDKDLDEVLEIAVNLNRENPNEKLESKAYYMEFAKAGLIKGGEAEVEKDYYDLEKAKRLIKEKEELLDKKKLDTLEKNKKVATIVECAISYCVLKLKWYGQKISIDRAPEFDDIKRGTDDVFEIKNNEDESYFMGLGIDVTYTGLMSEKFKNKFFKLLGSIAAGYKTEIKYFKNHDGKMMKEFAVPKVVLFFNVNEVRELVRMIKNINDPKALEEFKNSPLKIAVMNQLIIQCELLADFAEKHHNSISGKYTEIVLSIKQLSRKDPAIKAILDARHEDEVSHHIKYLIKEFEYKEEQENKIK